MRKHFVLTVAVGAYVLTMCADGAERKLYVEEFRDRMAGGWMGQNVGVAYGAPTEGRRNGEAFFKAAEIPKWTPERIFNTFEQDDLYVEFTFLETLVKRGIDVSCREAGIDFANTTFRTWCANGNARNNLRRGIAAPSSSHPKNHPSSDDIDYQIESDYSGLISPGLPTRVLRLGETFGRIMNYGDGLYAGQFVGSMYAEAYFEKDRVKVVETALKSIPADSGYAEMVRDVLGCYRDDPKDWQKAWRFLVDRYGRDKGPRMGKVTTITWMATVNGAWVLVGYLWGEGDIQRTLDVATACGYDSDCNPSSALGVLGVQLGLKAFGPEWVSKFDKTCKWEHTDYDWPKLLEVSENLARQIVVAEGGRIERDAKGEYFLIPEKPLELAPTLSSKKPGSGGDERYTERENAEIRFRPCVSPGAPSVCKTVKPGLAVKSGDSIAFLGDSITQFGNNANGYVNLVMDGLAVLGVQAKKIPAGISGNKSNDMLARVDRDCLSKKPTFMALSCGVNDVWHADWGKGVPLEEYKANISAILDKAAASNVEVVVLSPTLIGEDHLNAKNRKLDPYVAWLREEAYRRGLRYEDLTTRMRDHLRYLQYVDQKLGGSGKGNMATVDGVHMNYHGNMMMACGVLNALGVTQEQMDVVWKSWRERPGTMNIEVKLSLEEQENMRKQADGKPLSHYVREKIGIEKGE